MEAEELRIGNIIEYDNNGTPIAITMLGRNDCYYNDTCYSSYKLMNGIPLTEEWLVKFGFEKSWSTENYSYFEYDEFQSLKDYGTQGVALALTKEVYTHVYCGYYDNEIDCEHVHQLQNLYFALTGEELKT